MVRIWCFHCRGNGLIPGWGTAAAAAKSLQSYLTLCDPIDGSSPGSPVPGILQARTLEWVAISFSNAWKGKVKVKSPSCVRLLATPWTATYQAPPSMGFSRQEYWSGLPLPSPSNMRRIQKTSGEPHVLWLSLKIRTVQRGHEPEALHLIISNTHKSRSIPTYIYSLPRLVFSLFEFLCFYNKAPWLFSIAS